MAKSNDPNKGFSFYTGGGNKFRPAKKQKQVFVHHYKMDENEDERDARIADAAYEAYLKDPSGALPLDELITEWEAQDAKQEKAKR